MDDRNRRPSPAIIVAVVALVAALSGTALAAPGDDDGLTKKDVKKIAKKKSNKQIDKRVPWGERDLGPNSVTSEQLSAFVTHQTVATIAPGTSETIVANCAPAASDPSLPGENLISGGVRTGPGTTSIEQSHQQGEGWSAEVRNDGGAPVEVQVEANCLVA